MDNLSDRVSPIHLTAEEFKRAGHRLVDRIAHHLHEIGEGPVTPAETVDEVRTALGSGPMPRSGMDAEELLMDTAELLYNHSLFIGHPRFWGYITSASAPVGMLGDMLAASVNPNVASWILAPMATEIEAQTIRWMAEMIGYPTDCGGILVSGGNMANFVGLLAARASKTDWNVRERGLRAGSGQLRVYVSGKTHTWIQNATDLFGLGTEAIRWIDVDEDEKMNPNALDEQISRDLEASDIPFMVVGTAGTVGSGAIDPLVEISDVCRKYDLWFHIDGAYGAFAAILPDAPEELAAITHADSVALDPHKWLYAPLEAGCTLVKDPEHLRGAFSFTPEYYTFADRKPGDPVNFFELGMQNSRGFRALKVWLGMKQVGLDGYRRMIGDDVHLSRELFNLLKENEEIEAVSNSLSITTFRYVPPELSSPSIENDERLNSLNREVLDVVQRGGEAFVSNAIIRNRFLLRTCIVNFRTTYQDISALPDIIVRAGRQAWTQMS